jgi:phosphoglycolate phosphatase-like HAD superfamily hydrolase
VMRQKSSGAPEEREAGRRYLRVPTPRGGNGFAVNKSSRELLGKVDAVVFDCDGVLIDARKSYDETIRVVVETMVEDVTGVRLRLARVVPRLISTIRRTGGFNSDWDTSYALTLFSLVALGQQKEGSRGPSPRATEALVNITTGFGSAPRGRGQEAVDSFLEAEFPSMQDSLERSREYLGYPEIPPEGRMTTVFDELYFGASLFEKLHGVPARNARAKGLIELEQVLVSRQTLDSLAKMLGGARLAMVTGRPYLGAEYSLGNRLMSYFDKASSMFIGDADIYPGLRTEYDRFRKPNPEALMRAKEKLSSATLLYVGDSAEDLMMVKNAKRTGLTGYLFAGVYQTSPEPKEQVSFFERESSDIIVENVNQVPSGLLLQTKDEGTGEA